MNLPSSIDIARNVIKANPELFTDHYLCEIMISEAMRYYYEQSREYALQDQSKINEIKEQLNQLNNLIK